MNLFDFIMKVCPSRISNEGFIKHLAKQGVTCGKHTKFFDITRTSIDASRPWLLEIGDYCKIAPNVTILTHDYSRSVLRRVYGDIVAEAKKTVIGNNVFIGMNSIILMGTKIGDNVIIGAGSVVSGVIPSNCVAAGNPAKVIRTLDEHYKIRKEKYISEAKENALAFKKKYGRFPTIKEMESFFPLYLERDRKALKANDIFTNLSGDDEEDIIEKWLSSAPQFESYEKFLEFCKEKIL